jgi:hypothetical protein
VLVSPAGADELEILIAGVDLEPFETILATTQPNPTAPITAAITIQVFPKIPSNLGAANVATVVGVSAACC